MLCFNHSETDAVGVCRSCQRGICHECATDLDHGLACKGKHEAQVEALEMIVNQSKKIYAVTPKTRNATPLFYGFMGAVFIVTAISRDEGIASLSFAMGLGFIVFAAYCYLYNKKAYASNA